MIVRPRPDAAARLRLFCFPYAGGGASVYRRWTTELPAWIELCAVQPPGREERIGVAPIADLTRIVDDVADAMTPLLDRPFAIFGHSLGAALGYETARVLARRGAPEPLLLVVSGHRAPHAPRVRPPIYALPDAEFLDAIFRLDGTPADVLQSEELVALLLPALRADFTLADTYEPSSSQPLACPVRALGGAGDPFVSEAALAAWAEVTRGAFGMRMFAGGHFYLNTQRGRLIAYLVRELGHRLAAV